MENLRPALFVSQPAHHTVVSSHHLDTSRDKGKTFTDDPPQDLTFDDILDIINPLQHLPVISTLYRAITGDKIKPAMQIMGDLGYGGPSGFVLSCFQVLFSEISGDSIGGHVMSFLEGKDSTNVAAGVPASDDGAVVQVASAAGSDPAPVLPNVSDAIRSYGDGTNR